MKFLVLWQMELSLLARYHVVGSHAALAAMDPHG